MAGAALQRFEAPGDLALGGNRLFYVRSTRLVAGARAALAAFLAVAVLFGSLAPGLEGGIIRPLIVGYLAYSLILFGVSRSRRFAYRLLRRPLLPTVIDIAAFTAIFYLTDGADSPFFSPLVFLILSATLQWGSRGAIMMSLVTLVVFLPAGVLALVAADEDGRGALSAIVRLGYIVVVTFLLTGFGRHFERMIDELSRMADPVDVDFGQTEPPISEALRHALSLFRTRRGVVLWAEGDEPYLKVIEADGDSVRARTLPPGGDDWLVAPELQDAVFVYDRASDAAIMRPDTTSRVVRGPPVAPSVLATLDFQRMLVLPLHAPPSEGVILVLDQEEPTTEDLAFGAMVGAQVSSALQRWQAQMTQRATAAAAERVRLSRDLHDGVLQFLAGAAMQIEGLLRTGNLPVAAKVRLMGLRQALSDEQKELRTFITAMRPARPGDGTPPLDLAAELEDLTDHLSRYWNISVTARVRPDMEAPASLAYDIGRIVREAVANAVRHGRARSVIVIAECEGDRLTLEVADDGQGFAFQGEMGDEDLRRAGVGPRSLQERARALGGRLRIVSGARGARLHIDLPLEGIAA